MTFDSLFSLTNDLLQLASMNPGNGRAPSAWPCNHSMRMLVKTRQWCSTINTHDRANIELFGSSPSTLVLSLFNGNQGRRSREGRRRTTGRRSVLLIGGGKGGETESDRDGNLILLRRSMIGEWRLSPVNVERILPGTRSRQGRRLL